MKKENKTLPKLRIVLCLGFLFSPLFSPLSSARSEDNANNYFKLVSLYNRFFRLQEELFRELTFKLSSEQSVKGGHNFKLVLEDNSGKKWIFKEKGINRVIAQRLYALFNVETPQIHKVSLVLNGKPIRGTLQEFIPEATTLHGRGPGEISRAGLDYLMRAQALDWLMRDNDAHSRNFLILSFDQSGKGDRLMRIDQDCACQDSDSNYLDNLNMVAVDKEYPASAKYNYYFQIALAYRKKEIDLDLNGAYAFVRFVADFPEELLEKVIWPLREDGGKLPADNDFSELKEKYAFSRGYLLASKRAMAQDFKKLYHDMASFRDPSFKLQEKPAVKKNIKEAAGNFEKKIRSLSKEHKRGKSGSAAVPVEISAIASLDGFYVMQSVYSAFWQGRKEQLPARCQKALEELAALSSQAQPEEKKALEIYAREIRKIQSGQDPTYPLDEINKLIDPLAGK